MAQKFILAVRERAVDGYVAEFRLGNVCYHRDLRRDSDKGVAGGGCWKFDEEKKTLTLDDESADFGVPSWDFLKTLILPIELKDYTITYKYPRYMPYSDMDDVEVSKLDCVKYEDID